MAGLFPLRGISKVAKSLIGGVDEAAEAASRTRRMQEAERSVAAAGQAEREALKEAGHYAELPGEARRARQTAATTEREEILDIMGEAGLEDPNSVKAILREAYGSTPPKSSLDFLEPQWADDLASAEPVAQTSKGTSGLERENILGPDGRPRIKMSESTGHLVPDRPLLKLDPATRGTSPAPRNPASGRPILGVGPNRAPVTPKTDAAGRQIQGMFSGMSDAMGGGALADALGPASRGVSKSIDDVAATAKVKPSPTPKTARIDLTEEGFDNFHYNDYRKKFATGDLDNLGPMEKVVKDFSERDPELWKSFVRDVAEMDPNDPFVITDFVENYMNTVKEGARGITGVSVLPSHNFIDIYRRTAAELPELFRVDPETLHIIYSPDPNWVRSIDAGLPAQKGYFQPPTL